MRKLIKLLYLLLPLSLSCSDSGNSSVPQLPLDPEGTVTHAAVTKNSRFNISLFDAPIYVDDTLGLYGDGMRFADLGECKGVGYIIEIPREGWAVKGKRLRERHGYVVSNVTSYGSTFAAMYVENIDSAGNIQIKTLSPIYGKHNSFAINTKYLSLPPHAGDTAVYIIHPTGYEVELANGEWLRAVPNVSFVNLTFDSIASGIERCDTLRFYNDKFGKVEIPVVQSGIL